MPRIALALALVPLLAACTMEPLPEPPREGTCDAANLQDLVGQSSSVLAAMTFQAPMRVIKPGMAVTMDYREDRLNVEVNAAEIITRVYCG